ncbi:hypothetical protein IFM89_018493 [Coptis chinensis]|uniref:Uncharacterized protein n=1 Tax=Coptis chinensis TaxID=261450 RepID=A0A835IP83_9MAGN|nr:hypothetical protein IFM89_018493 [Coptis chinensis]
MTQKRRPPQHSSSCDPDCCNPDCYDPDYSGRRTGGRVGGRYFSSNSSTSSPPIKPSNPNYTDKDSSTSKSKSSNIDDDLLLLGTIGAAVIVIVIGFIILPYVWEISGQNDPLKTSVVMLQVGLHGTARSVQKTLDQITEEADTSKREGLSPILTETALALLRKQDCWISCFSSVDVKKSSEDGEKRFLELGTEERAKFEEETLVKVNNVKKKRTRIQSVDGFGNEYIVVRVTFFM